MKADGGLNFENTRNKGRKENYSFPKFSFLYTHNETQINLLRTNGV